MAVLSTDEEKLKRILDYEGYEDLTDLARDVLYGDRPGCPGICMNEGCNYIRDMEPDQDSGWRDECKTNSMKSGLLLGGLI